MCFPHRTPRQHGAPGPGPASLAGLALAGLLAACGPADGDDSPTAGGPTLRDSAGVRLVLHPAPGAGASGARAPRHRLEGVRTLDGAALGGFGRIRALAVGPAGAVHVLERGSRRISIWDREGRLVRSFGGVGDGPGEFRSPAYLRVLDDGRVLVGEMLPARLHRFGRDGRVESTVRLPQPRGTGVVGGLAEWRANGKGTVRVRVALLSPTAPEGTRHVLLAVDADATVRDTLLTWTQPGSTARLPRVFEPHWSWRLGPDGQIYLSRGGSYEIRRYGPRGRLRGVIRRAVTPVPVDADLRRRAVEQFVAGMSRGGAPEAVLRSVEDEIEVAPHLPAVSDLWLSEPEGEVWVGVPEPAPGQALVRVGAFDRFGADGRFLGRVAAPRRFRLMAVRGGLAYGVWKDPLDVEHVRVYRRRADGTTAGEG